MSRGQPPEHRRAPRKRLLKGGIIAFSGRHATLPCTVRDLSDTGARLHAEQAIRVPDTFELLIELDGLEAECQVIWRRATEIGVQFLAPPNLVAPKRAQVVKASGGPPARSSLRRPTILSAPAVQPQAAMPEPAPPTAAMEQPLTQVTAPQATTARATPLLVVEDDPDDITLIEQAFSDYRFAHPVAFVENGEQMLRYLAGEPPYQRRPMPALILLDLNMPRMDGRTALAHMRAVPQFRRIPVIALTTSRSEQDIAAAYDLGVNAYIPKPSTHADLMELVTMLDRHWLRMVSLPGR